MSRITRNLLISVAFWVLLVIVGCWVLANSDYCRTLVQEYIDQTGKSYATFFAVAFALGTVGCIGFFTKQMGWWTICPMLVVLFSAYAIAAPSQVLWVLNYNSPERVRERVAQRLQFEVRSVPEFENIQLDYSGWPKSKSAALSVSGDVPTQESLDKLISKIEGGIDCFVHWRVTVRQQPHRKKTMTLEEQIAALDKLGIRLDDEITIDDLLYSFDRTSYEETPFDLILFVYGGEVEREPWGRSICSNVWNFDTECINATGDYVSIVKRICEIADCSDRITNIQDSIDIANRDAWLKYEIDGKQRHWTVEVTDDWADRMTISYLLDDIESDGKRFFYIDNGQAMLLFYLDLQVARQLGQLTNDALQLVNPN